MTSLSVVIADDAMLFREALASVLTGAGFDVRAQVGDVDSLHRAVGELTPDLAVVDIRMPPTHDLEGLVAAVALRRAHPRLGVLVLSQHLETRLLRTLVGNSTRGVGYLLKERVSGIQDFVAAAREVTGGNCAFDPEIVARLTRSAPQHDRIDRLTDREHQILSLIAQGRSNQAICEQLVLTKKTVESHIRSILLRLDLQPEPDFRNRRTTLTLDDLGLGHGGFDGRRH